MRYKNIIRHSLDSFIVKFVHLKIPTKSYSAHDYSTYRHVKFTVYTTG